MRYLFGIALLMMTLASPAVANDASLQDIKAELAANHLQSAEEALRQRVEDRPEDYEAWFLLGVSQTRSRHYHRAIEAFRRVIELRPNLPEPHNNLAYIYNELGDLHAAVHDLEQSLQKRPDNAEVEESLGDLHMKLAMDYYRRALKQQSDPLLAARYERLLHVRDPLAKPEQVGEKQVAVAEGVARKPQSRSASVADAEASEPVDTGEAPADGTGKTAARAAAPIPPAGTAMAAGKTKPEAVPGADSGTSVAARKGDQPERRSEAGGSAEKQPKHVADARPDDQAQANAAGAEEKAAVLAAVEAWRRAWSAQDIAGYFAAYADDFRPGERFADLQAWKQYKRRVIGNKQFIKVAVDALRVKLSNDGRQAKVHFRQHFRSDTFSSDDQKTLTLVRRGENWKIAEEASK